MLHTLITILAVILIVVIMLQSKGTGLSIVPGSNDFGKFERRGAEKTLHTITIALVAIFVGLSIMSYFVS
jgi:protein translocase SecG subunit